MLALVAASPLRAQAPECVAEGTVRLQETVIDRMTRVPLRDASIIVSWREAGAQRQVEARTDSAGRAWFCVPAQQQIGIRASYRNVQGAPLTVVPTALARNTHSVLLDVPHIYAQGLVLDHATGAPVANAAVRLTHTSLDVLTGADGRFAIPRIPIGDYLLSIEHPSYAAASTPLVAGSADLNATFRVTPEAIPLEPVVVTAFSRRLDHVGFYERQRRGAGTFIPRSQIEATRPQFASDILRRVPGVRIITTPPRRDAPRSYTMGRGSCRFRFIIDGTRVLPDFELDNIAPMFIEGIEIYAGLAQVPAMFRAQGADGIAPTCGVIAVWTKDGR